MYASVQMMQSLFIIDCNNVHKKACNAISLCYIHNMNDLKKYIAEKPKAISRIITSVKLSTEIYNAAYALKGHMSFTKLLETLLKRFIDENKQP